MEWLKFGHWKSYIPALEQFYWQVSVVVNYFLSSHLIMKYDTTLAATDVKNAVNILATLLSVVGLENWQLSHFTRAKNIFQSKFFLKDFYVYAIIQT